jgi:hypothetical protein
VFTVYCVHGLTTTVDLLRCVAVSFNVFDADGDGELSRAEVERMLLMASVSGLRVSGVGYNNRSKLAEVAKVVAQQVFDKFDADQVRPLQDLDFFFALFVLSVGATLCSLYLSLSSQLTCPLCANQSGTISRAEFMTGCANHPDVCEFMNMLDAHRSYGPIFLAWEKAQPRRPPPRIEVQLPAPMTRTPRKMKKKKYVELI